MTLADLIIEAKENCQYVVCLLDVRELFSFAHAQVIHLLKKKKKKSLN